MKNLQKTNEPLDSALRLLYTTAEPPAEFDSSWRAAIRREEISMENNETKKKGTRIWRTLIPIAVALLLVIGTLGTGDWENSSNGNYSAPQAQSYSGSEKSAVFGTSSLSRSSSNYVSADYAVYEEAVEYDAAPETPGEKSAGAGAVELTDNRKLVRSVDLSIRSAQYDQAIEAIRQSLAEAGGYIESMNQSGDPQSGKIRSASMTLRIPAEHLDDFLEGMNEVGRVISRNESTRDYTTQYSDNETRLTTLRTKMARLNALLEKAEAVSDMLEIESAISETQYEIELLEGSQLSIDRKVDYSTVTVSLKEEKPVETAASEKISLGERLLSGLKATFEWLKLFARNLLVFIVMLLPVLFIIAVIVGIILLILKARKKRRSVSASVKGTSEKE